MLKVFQPTDKVFSTNGDAVINATRAIVKKVDNSTFELSLECSLDYSDFIKVNNI